MPVMVCILDTGSILKTLKSTKPAATEDSNLVLIEILGCLLLPKCSAPAIAATDSAIRRKPLVTSQPKEASATRLNGSIRMFTLVRNRPAAMAEIAINGLTEPQRAHARTAV